MVTQNENENENGASDSGSRNDDESILGAYQNYMGSRMPDLPSIPRMDMTLHPF